MASSDERVQRPPTPPPLIVAELVRAGISLATAMAMEGWKAQEVLDLLRSDGHGQAGDQPRPVPAPGTM